MFLSLQYAPTKYSVIFPSILWACVGSAVLWVSVSGKGVCLSCSRGYTLAKQEGKWAKIILITSGPSCWRERAWEVMAVIKGKKSRNAHSELLFSIPFANKLPHNKSGIEKKSGKYVPFLHQICIWPRVFLYGPGARSSCSSSSLPPSGTWCDEVTSWGSTNYVRGDDRYFVLPTFLCTKWRRNFVRRHKMRTKRRKNECIHLQGLIRPKLVGRVITTTQQRTNKNMIRTEVRIYI